MTRLAHWFSPQPAQVYAAQQSRFYQQLTNWLTVACIILLTVNSARIIYRSIYSEVVFVDQIYYTRMHYNVILSLTPAGALITAYDSLAGASGFVGSGLGAAVFVLGGDLFHSRIIVAALDTLLAVLIGVALFRSWSFGLAPAVLGATLIWGLTVTTPFALPYWHGFVYNLGELPGALVIALGLLVCARRPHLAAFCWGLVAWHTKPVIFPVPLFLIFASAWSIPAPIRSKLRQIVRLLSTFLLPLIFWLLFISARFGVAAAATHLTTFGGFIGLYPGHYQVAQPLYQLKSIGNPLSVARLISRLQDPHLEWSQSYYTLGTKLKVVSLSLGSVAVTLLALYKQRPADRHPFTTLASWVLMVMVLAYTYWWFMLHPTMWMRHFQPALYIGLGLWIFWLLQISIRFSLFDRPFLRWGAIAFVTTFVAWQAYFSWGISTRISDFPTQWRCPITNFVSGDGSDFPGFLVCKRN